MVTLFALALAASAAAPAPPPAPRVSVLASAVAVILPAATNDGVAVGEGAVHRRLARGSGAVWAVYE